MTSLVRQVGLMSIYGLYFKENVFHIKKTEKENNMCQFKKMDFFFQKSN